MSTVYYRVLIGGIVAQRVNHIEATIETGIRVAANGILIDLILIFVPSSKVVAILLGSRIRVKHLLDDGFSMLENHAIYGVLSQRGIDTLTPIKHLNLAYYCPLDTTIRELPLTTPERERVVAANGRIAISTKTQNYSTLQVHGVVSRLQVKNYYVEDFTA